MVTSNYWGYLCGNKKKIINMELKIIKDAQQKSNYALVWILIIVGAIFMVKRK